MTFKSLAQIMFATPFIFAGCMPDPDPRPSAVDGVATTRSALSATMDYALLPPEISIMLNDNLSGLTQVLLPALAAEYGLDDTKLPKLPIFTDVTKASLGWVGDVLFACHDDKTPIVFDVRNLVLDMGITPHAVTAKIEGTADRHQISLDANLPGFALDGTLYFNWPAAATGSLLCLIPTDYHFEIPFSVRGASAKIDLGFGVADNTLALQTFQFKKLSVTDVTIDIGALDLLSELGLAVSDGVVTAYQRLQDGLFSTNLQPEQGICNTAGSTADLAACVGALASGYVAQQMSDEHSDLRNAIFDMLALPLPPPADFTVGKAAFSVAPQVVGYAESSTDDSATIKVTLGPQSSASPAACAADVKAPLPKGDQSHFTSQGDLDIVVPFDSIESSLYQVARQGTFCLPTFAVAGVNASIDSSGPVTVSNPTTPAPLRGVSALPGGSTGTAPPPPAVDLHTTHPMRLAVSAAAGAVTGAVNVTVDLGWQLALTCDNRIAVQLINAKRTALSGVVTVGRKVVDGSDAQVAAAIDAQIAKLPALVPQVPLGPSVVGLPGGVYLALEQLASTSSAIQASLSLETALPAACKTNDDTNTKPGTVAMGGNDVVDYTNAADLGPGFPGNGSVNAPGTAGGTNGTTAPSTMSSTSTGGSTSGGIRP